MRTTFTKDQNRRRARVVFQDQVFNAYGRALMDRWRATGYVHSWRLRSRRIYATNVGFALAQPTMCEWLDRHGISVDRVLRVMVAGRIPMCGESCQQPSVETTVTTYDDECRVSTQIINGAPPSTFLTPTDFRTRLPVCTHLSPAPRLPELNDEYDHPSYVLQRLSSSMVVFKCSICGAMVDGQHPRLAARLAELKLQ